MADLSSPSDRTAELTAFAADGEKVSRYGTLLTYLVDTGRADDARALLDEPGQVVAKTIVAGLRALSLGAPWSRAMFDALLERAPEPAAMGELSLPFIIFHGDNDEELVHAVSAVIARWGVQVTLPYGQSLLTAVAKTGSDAAIATVLDAGATANEASFEGLLESTSLGRVSGRTIRRMAVGKVEVDGVLGSFLVSTRGRGRSYEAIADAVEALIEARVPKKRAIEDVSPIVGALALDLPVSDRLRLAERVIAAGYAKGPVADSLPELAGQLVPTGLGELLDALKHRPGTLFGKAGRGLLHFAALAACDLATEDSDTIDARIVPTFAALIARGESPSQADGKGKTPLDLAKPLKRDLEAKDWQRIEAALSGGAQGGAAKKVAPAKSFALFPAAGFALGVAGALVAAKKLDEKVLTHAWKTAAADADDPGSEEAEELAAEALAALPLTDAQLGAVKSLGFDFGDRIYARFEAATGTESGGESDVLNVSAIDGVAHLPTLERLDLSAYAGAVRALAPLAGHPSLKELLLQSAPEDETVLLTLPALRRVACRHLSAETVDRLRAAGVEVSDELARPAAKRQAAPKKPAPKKPAPKKPAPKKPAPKKPVAKKPAAKKKSKR